MLVVLLGGPKTADEITLILYPKQENLRVYNGATIGSRWANRALHRMAKKTDYVRQCGDGKWEATAEGRRALRERKKKGGS